MRTIRRNKIDSINEIDTSLLTFENLRSHYGTGESVTTGTGRDKIRSYRTGMETNIGDIELSLWIRLVKDLIEQSGEQELYEKLKEYVSKFGFVKTKDGLEEYALELFASRIFDNPEWVDYVPFNQKYRPEILRQAKLVTVVCSCCKQPGQITVERFNKAKETIPCPVCGRYSQFTVSAPDLK